MQYKVLTWNVKGKSSFGWDDRYIISSRLVDKFIEQKADIVVLTEFVVAKGIDYLFERLQNEGYIWFTTTRSGKNGILIAIKEGNLSNDGLVNNLYKSNTISSSIEECNILQVSLPLKCGKIIDVTGCRMETGGFKTLREQYDSERSIFDGVLLPAIKGRVSDFQIVCGDFNNARCLGDLNKPYCNEEYNDMAQINYNLNIIKDSFGIEGFVMADMNKDGSAIPTHKGFLPEDHIFVRGFTCEACNVLPSGGLSDHDIVIAKITIQEL